jgi:nucleoside-diphosphate-sugar epimerase
MSAVVVGGAGALGRALIAKLSRQGVPAISVDLVANPAAAHSVALGGDEWYRASSRALTDIRAQKVAVGSVFHVSTSPPKRGYSVTRCERCGLESPRIVSTD